MQECQGCICYFLYILERSAEGYIWAVMDNMFERLLSVLTAASSFFFKFPPRQQFITSSLSGYDLTVTNLCGKVETLETFYWDLRINDQFPVVEI